MISSALVKPTFDTFAAAVAMQGMMTENRFRKAGPLPLALSLPKPYAKAQAEVTAKPYALAVASMD